MTILRATKMWYRRFRKWSEDQAKQRRKMAPITYGGTVMKFAVGPEYPKPWLIVSWCKGGWVCPPEVNKSE